MPVPTSPTYSVTAKIAAHESFKTLIDSGSSAGSIKIRSSTDVLLAQIMLNDPCGTVNGTTGQLVFSISGPDTSADATGTAAYAEFCDSNGTVHLAVPATTGTSPSAGFIVLNTVSIVAGGPVEILSATLG